MDNDFTVDQAKDLATYFLGPNWQTFVVGPNLMLFNLEAHTTYEHSTWRAAGVKLPYRPRYASVGPRVLLGVDQVAVCKSSNFAVRTAAALNAYKPDAKGQ